MNGIFSYLGKSAINIMIKLVSAANFQKIVSMPEAIEVMRDLYRSLDENNFELPPSRTILQLKENSGYVFSMPSYLSDQDAISIKVATIIPNNKNLGLPLIHALVIFFNSKTGQIEFLLDGKALTAMRTGAMCGLATSLLAPTLAKNMGIIGAGIQAKSVLQAVLAVRDITHVKIYSRHKESSIQLKTHIEETYHLESIDIVDNANDAVFDVDIICTCTSNDTDSPVFTKLNFKKNVHINAIGGPSINSVEIPIELYKNAFVVVEEKNTAKNESGEIKKAYELKYIDDQSIVNIGHIANNKNMLKGERMTIFRSVGMSIQDTALANKVYKKINDFDLPSITDNLLL